MGEGELQGLMMMIMTTVFRSLERFGIGRLPNTVTKHSSLSREKTISFVWFCGILNCIETEHWPFLCVLGNTFLCKKTCHWIMIVLSKFNLHLLIYAAVHSN